MGVQVEDLDVGELIGLVSGLKADYDLRRDLSVRVAEGEVRRLHDGEAPPRVGENGHPDIRNSVHDAVVALIRFCERLTGKHGYLDLPGALRFSTTFAHSTAVWVCP